MIKITKTKKEMYIDEQGTFDDINHPLLKEKFIELDKSMFDEEVDYEMTIYNNFGNLSISPILLKSYNENEIRFLLLFMRESEESESEADKDDLEIIYDELSSAFHGFTNTLKDYDIDTNWDNCEECEDYIKGDSYDKDSDPTDYGTRHKCADAHRCGFHHKERYIDINISDSIANSVSMAHFQNSDESGTDCIKFLCPICNNDEIIEIDCDNTTSALISAQKNYNYTKDVLNHGMATTLLCSSCFGEPRLCSVHKELCWTRRDIELENTSNKISKLSIYIYFFFRKIFKKIKNTVKRIYRIIKTNIKDDIYNIKEKLFRFKSKRQVRKMKRISEKYYETHDENEEDDEPAGLGALFG